MVGPIVIALLIGLAADRAACGTAVPTVRHIRIEGTRHIGEDRVREWLVTRPGVALDSVAVYRDVQRILEGYRLAGLWQAAVARPEVRLAGVRASVVFRIDEGRPTRVGSLEITGYVGLPLVELTESMMCGPGVRLVQRKLEADLEALLSLYENRGYPYCAVKPEVKLTPGVDTARVRIVIDEGPFVRIDTVRFTGNGTTKPEVLRRELRLMTGEPYSQRGVKRVLQALRRLPFVLEAEEAGLETDTRTGRTALVIAVVEARSGRIHGGIGYAPNPGGSGTGLTGALSLDFVNVMGTGRQAHGMWERRGVSASDLRLRYREPWLGGRPLSAATHLAMSQRPGYSETRLGGDLELAPSPNLTVSVGFTRAGVRPDSSGFGQVLASRTWTGNTGFSYDRRDDGWNPRFGIWYRGTIAWGRTDRGREGHGRTEYALHLAHHHPMRGRTVLAMDLHGAGVREGKRVPPESRLRLGGSTTIRGHREEAFLAVRAVWANLECRMLLGRRSRAFAFLDAGWLTDQGTDGSAHRAFPMGYGVGLRLGSRSGIIGLDYGLTAGHGLGQGKVHLRMMGEF